MGLLQDLRFAVRLLVKDRWFTLVAVVTLALGIAANNAVFTFVNAVLIRGIPFKKSMRWDSLATDSFARPVHWIAATLDGKPLTVKFADVTSAPKTRSHRFAAPQEIPIPSARDYVATLRKAHVLADWAERSKRISEEVARGARDVHLAAGRPCMRPLVSAPTTRLPTARFVRAG